MCLNNPISIPTGTDGKSVTIAFASDSNGSNFSYTASDTLPYISFVTKSGSVSSTDFTNWVKYIGTDGVDGVDGISVISAQISDGSTPIGGTTYSVNNLIIGLGNGSFVNAGPINGLTLNWQDIILTNSWEARSLNGGVPQFAIDSQNMLRFRGVIDARFATSAEFTNSHVWGNSTTKYNMVGNFGQFVNTVTLSKLVLGVSSASISDYDAEVALEWNLNTIPPIYLG